MDNILVIAYDFPPILSPESIQSQRYVEKLKKEGSNVIVLTTHLNPDFEIIDTNLIKDLEVIRTKKVYLEKYRHIFWKVLNIIDRKFWWKNVAIKEAKKIIKKYNINKIITRSVPITDHFIGYELKKEFNIEWKAHFSDPWSMNPYDNRNILFKTIDKYLEKKLLSQVDVLSVTSNKTKELYLKKYPFLNIEINYHLYDETLYPNIDSNSNKIIITHTGNIYGLRSIKKLLEVIKECKRDDIEFEFYGKIKKEEKDLITKWNLSNKVKIFDTIPYLKSLKKMKESDYLLIVEASLYNSPFFPSKLVDYIGAKKPIILLGNKVSTSAEILKEHLDNYFIMSDVNEIKKTLQKLKNNQDMNIKNDIFKL